MDAEHFCVALHCSNCYLGNNDLKNNKAWSAFVSSAWKVKFTLRLIG
jgi:hypothetical protein